MQSTVKGMSIGSRGNTADDCPSLTLVLFNNEWRWRGLGWKLFQHSGRLEAC